MQYKKTNKIGSVVEFEKNDTSALNAVKDCMSGMRMIMIRGIGYVAVSENFIFTEEMSNRIAHILTEFDK